MAGDKELGAREILEQRSREINVKGDVVVWGANTEKFVGGVPKLRRSVEKDLHFSFRIENPGSEEAIIIVPGVANHSQIEAPNFRGPIQELDASLVIFARPPFTAIPELLVAQVEDLCQEEGVKRAMFYGTSLGGLDVLRLVRDIHQRNLDIGLAAIVTAGAPTGVDDLQPLVRKAIKSRPFEALNWLAGRSTAFGLAGRPIQDQFGMKHTLRTMRSQLVNAAAAGFETGFSREEFPNDVPFLVFTPTGPDPYVNSRQAAEKIRGWFNNVTVETYEGRHVPKDKQEEAKVTAKVLDFFREASRQAGSQRWGSRS